MEKQNEKMRMVKVHPVDKAQNEVQNVLPMPEAHIV